MSTTIPPTLELKEEIREKVQRFLEETFDNIHRKVGQTVRLVCNNPITALVMMNLPGSHLAWDINGEPMTMDPSRVFYYKGNIDITDLTPGDTGVYECIARWISGNVNDNVTVGIYSLQVTAASTTRYVYEYEPLRLRCNSESLGRLFPAATRQWLLNDRPFTSLPVMMADNGSVEVINKVHKNHSGVWQCQVTHSRTGRVWDTAWMNVTVDDPPSFIARWYRHMTEHTGVVFAVLGLIIVISFLIFLYSAYQIKHMEDEADRQFMKERSGWEDLLSGFVEKGSITVDDIPDPKENEAGKGGDVEDGDKGEGGDNEDVDKGDEGDDEDGDKGEGAAKGEDRGESEEDVSENATEKDRSLRKDGNRSNSRYGELKRAYQKTGRRKKIYRVSLQGAGDRRASRGLPMVTGPKLYPALTAESAFHWLNRCNSKGMKNIDPIFNKAAKVSLVDSYNARHNPLPKVDTLGSSSDETFLPDCDRLPQQCHLTTRRVAPDKLSEAAQGSSRGHPVHKLARGPSRFYLKPWLSRNTYAVDVDHVGGKCDIKMKKLGRGIKYSRLSQVEDDSI